MTQPVSYSRETTPIPSSTSRSASPNHPRSNPIDSASHPNGWSKTSSTLLKGPPLKPFETSQIKILLLENVNETAVQMFNDARYQVEVHKKALSKEQLLERIKDVHAVGIRSKTKLTKEVLDAAEKLLVVGCFCIGTNQVDLEHAALKGIAVFNSPFSNSRSVAELVIGEIIALARQIGDRNLEMHSGTWSKLEIDYPEPLTSPTDPHSAVFPLRSPHSLNRLSTSLSLSGEDDATAAQFSKATRQKYVSSFEIRGKILGIIGYGHIGSQLAVLTEALGMRVIYYDVKQLMPLGSSYACGSLEELLQYADFVTLHVPETPQTKNFIDKPQLDLMKRGSYLLNLSRGSVVCISALVEALKSGHLAGAAVDVYPSEPHSNGPGFVSELQNCKNVILTPHIGGSTEEAQSAIGVEVGSVLIKYLNTGSSTGAVNFPEVDLRNPPFLNSPAEAADDSLLAVRIINVHRNVPGVLKQINKVLSDFNVEKQICDSKDNIGYIMADMLVKNDTDLRKIQSVLLSIPETLKVRLLYNQPGGKS